MHFVTPDPLCGCENAGYWCWAWLTMFMVLVRRAVSVWVMHMLYQHCGGICCSPSFVRGVGGRQLPKSSAGARPYTALW